MCVCLQDEETVGATVFIKAATNRCAVLIRVGVHTCLPAPVRGCVCGMKVSDYPVASPRPHGENSGLTWMRSSRSSQGTLPWTR